MNNLLTNKYFCIAILIALIVVVFLYFRKKSCNMEGMTNIDLTSLGHQPTEQNIFSKTLGRSDQLKKISDKGLDKTELKKYLKKGKDKLDRSDFKDYLEKGKDKLKKYLKKHQDKYPDKKLSGVPMPLDNRPDLSQCQPCICPGDSLSDSSSSSDSSHSQWPHDYETKYLQKKYRKDYPTKRFYIRTTR